MNPHLCWGDFHSLTVQGFIVRCDDPDLQAVFQSLAAMEKDHKYKMEERFVKVAYPEAW